MKSPKLKYIFLVATFQLVTFSFSYAQKKQYMLTTDGDTVNVINKEGKKEGKWIIHTDELRGNPGFEEEGVYKKGEKDGYWRKYNLQGDLIAVENYKFGGKDGLQQYFTYLGDLEHEEMWKAYNPDAPYDTIPVYGTGSNEIVEYKIVKAETYSVKDGDWKFYEPGSGRVLRTEKWQRNNLMNPAAKLSMAAYEKPKKVQKTDAMLEWEKKNRGKKGAVRDGRTGL